MRFSLLPADAYIVDEDSSSDEAPTTSRRKPLGASLSSNIRRAFTDSDNSDEDDWDGVEDSLAFEKRRAVPGPSMVDGVVASKVSTQKTSARGKAKAKARLRYQPPAIPLEIQYQSAAFSMPPDELETWQKESSLQSWRSAKASSSKLSETLLLAQAQAFAQAQAAAEERLRIETDEVRAMLGNMEVGYEQRERVLKDEFEARNKRLWSIINGTIAESDRLHKEKLAEQAKLAEQRKAEAAAKAAAAENLAKKRAQEEEAKAKEEAEAKSRREAEAEILRVKDLKQRDEGVMSDLGDKGREWVKWRDSWRAFKQGVVEVVKVDDAARQELRIPMRAITRGIGQVVNSREAILRVTAEIEENLNKALLSSPTPTSPITSASSPPQMYSYLLSHISKALIKQAEAEVNAHPEAAFPLAKIVVGLLLRGHAMLGEVLFGRLVKKCPWVVPFWPAKQEGQPQRDYDKSLGQTGREGSAEYASRMAGILTFYFSILQTPLSPLLQAGPPSFSQPSPESLQTLFVEPLRLPAAWSWLAAIPRMPLAGLDPAPLLIAVALEIVGPEMSRVYGQRQVGKVLMAIATEGLGEGVDGGGVLANSNVPARQRLRLMIVEQLEIGNSMQTVPIECHFDLNTARTGRSLYTERDITVVLTAMSFYLVLVSPLDTPLFELSFQTSRPIPSTPQQPSSSYPSWSTFASSSGADLTGSKGAVANATGQAMGDRHLMQMVAHAALDVVEEVMVGTGSMYHKTIDRYNEWMVSAFVAPGVKLLLLHDLKNEDGIRLFFVDVWEAYVKTFLNPFHTTNTPIRSSAFEARVRASAKRHL